MKIVRSEEDMKFGLVSVIVISLFLAAVAVAMNDEMIERLVQTVERMQEEIHQLKGEINRCNNHTKDSLKS